mmetsp:Transcript_62015/g.202320  ORF Transcript_62015/g.202320 Transcript_62015/m.202320 type:complete len:657 (+) Transcript_62015:88-2058(+)
MRFFAIAGIAWACGMLPGEAVSETAGGEVATEDESCMPEADGDEVGLLTLARSRSKQQGALQSFEGLPKPKSAIAFAGGGFRAVAVAAATTSGALWALGEGRSLGTLLGGFDMISSISGGSWFSAELIYSPSFVDLIGEMAQTPESAGVIFNDTWITALLQSGANSWKNHSEANSTVSPCLAVSGEVMNQVKSSAGDAKEILVDVCIKYTGRSKLACKAIVNLGWPHLMDAIGGISLKIAEDIFAQTGIPILQDAAQAVYILEDEGGWSWEDVVAALLEKTSGIGPRVSMGSELASWATVNSQIWNAGTSIVTPIDNATAYYYQSDLQQDASATFHVLPSPQNVTPRSYIPARFTVMLGSGTDSQAPYPFCATEDCFGVGLTIQGSNTGSSTSRVLASLGPSFQQAFTESAGRLPVQMVAASSSAAMGAAILNPVTTAVSDECANMATWVSNATDGESWAVAGRTLETGAYREVNQSSIDALAENSVQALIDGAYTDNSGIAWAVSSGATEVLTVLNSGVGSLTPLFQGSGASYGVGFTKQLHFQIFAETATSILDAYSEMPVLQIPVGSNTYLKNMTWGTLNVTTVNNQWFGIREGTTVTLRVLAVTSSEISMAGFTDYYHYGTFLNEMTSTIAYGPNAEAVRTIVDTFYLGGGR